MGSVTFLCDIGLHVEGGAIELLNSLACVLVGSHVG